MTQPGCVLLAVTVLLAPRARVIGQEAVETAPLSSTLHFSPEIRPAVVEPLRSRADSVAAIDESLRFDAVETLPDGPAGEDLGSAPESSLSVLAELTLLRVRRGGGEDGAPLDPAGSPREVSLRFNDEHDAGAIWGESEVASSGVGRWEVIPDLYLRSGRVYDAGYESIDYADLYAELGVDLTNNTGIWLRYERLRQALGSSREGEQVDADALFLQFELRF